MSNAFMLNKRSLLVGLILLSSFLLPHTNVYLMLVNPLLCLLLFLYKNNKILYFLPLLFFVPVFFSFLINIQDICTKAFFSISSILLYFLLFPLLDTVTIKNRFLHICLLIIVLSQIVYILDVPVLTDLFNAIYPVGDNEIGLELENSLRDNVTWNNVTDFRLGGLYHNANICAEFVTFLLAFYLSYNNDQSSAHINSFSLVSFISILLTGSRTGLIVASIILAFYYFRIRKIRFQAVAIIALLVIVIFVCLSSSLRSFKVESGLEVSINMKLSTFLFYLSNENSILRWLFGYADPSRFTGGYGNNIMDQFDSDYGNIIYCYGLVGFFGLLSFLWLLWKKLDRQSCLFYITLLWMFSATIFFSYRASFAYMFLLSILYSKCKINNCNVLIEE